MSGKAELFHTGHENSLTTSFVVRTAGRDHQVELRWDA